MEPLVSCHIITYNQKDFIRQCIESVLAQQTNFPYEIVIGDDCSTDGTREILMEYRRLHPGIIVLNLRERRGGGIPGKENFSTTFEMCRGAYISLLDGDDYWTDSSKLQQQTDFLVANPDYSICFHATEVKYEAANLPPVLVRAQNPQDTTSIDQLANGNYIHTPTVVFRNVLKSRLPGWFKHVYPGDWPLHMLNAAHGKIKYIDKKMSVYRVHGGGIHSMFMHPSIKYFPAIAFLIGELSINNKNIHAVNILLRQLNIFSAASYGIENEAAISRISRSKILFWRGGKKMKFLFWLPVLFGNKSQKIWQKINR